MTVTRRGFLQLLGGAIAAAGAGITMRPGNAASPSSSHSLVHARHLYWVSLENVGFFNHRIDVQFVGPKGVEQWGVDCISLSTALDPERDLAPALAQLNAVLEEKGFEVGEIFTYSYAEWEANDAARARWARIGAKELPA